VGGGAQGPEQATVQAMQLRVMALYESVVTAMPAVGFALGGAIAAVLSPPARRPWPRHAARSSPS
jgi:hypothetical protein